jgi:G6PDH family F420-dependent oxidoreductase
VPQQRHSPYVWSVLGAVAAVTERVELATMVTCPTVRYHPAIVAQKAATIGVLSQGRFTLGVGAGEQLNEHVVGAGWPPVDVRHEMLEEAVEIFRLLWQGGYRSYRGQYYTVEDAQVFDLPDETVPVGVAASGPRSAELAGRVGDCLICNEPKGDVVEGFRRAGGTGKPAWGQVVVCWGQDQQAALELAHRQFRWAPLGWKVMSELPNPVNFDAASAAITPEKLSETIPTGPDPEPYVDAVRQFTEAGFERLAFYQIGSDQAGFMRFWEQELRPRLAAEPVPAGAVS